MFLAGIIFVADLPLVNTDSAKGWPGCVGFQGCGGDRG
jgi:hypothetical protein